MTMTTTEETPRRSNYTPLRRKRSRRDKVWSLGLAVLAFVGVGGLIQTRTTTDEAKASTVDAASTVGYTAGQLEAYAASLADQQAKLQAYQAQLVTVAASLNKIAGGASVTPATVASIAPPAATPKVTSKPKAQRPQSTTKSS